MTCGSKNLEEVLESNFLPMNSLTLEIDSISQAVALLEYTYAVCQLLCLYWLMGSSVIKPT